MSKKILFSPIGGTDPIKYSRDGSMLHICRHYLPDVVYLYLSKEILECHRKDNRYVDSIERLGNYLNHSFEVRIFERPELQDVHQYDLFYQDFRGEIGKIEREMEQGDELLVNMASGTPAMKSALLVIATFAEYRFKAIQVSTPQDGMNVKHEDRENYDGKENWEKNRDNDEGAKNRCEEVKCLGLMKMLKIEIIKKHILAYDYTAALAVASEIKRDISEDAYMMLKIADARIKLNLRKISELMRKKSYDIYPIQEGSQQKVFEYALALKTRIKKEEYADFIRGITPLVIDVLGFILYKVCNVRLKDCCYDDNKNGSVENLKWNWKKLQEYGLLKKLEDAYKTKGGFKVGPVYSSHIGALIQAESKDGRLKKSIDEILVIEGKLRNVAAHKMVSVTEEWFMKETGKNATQIFELIKYLIKEAGIVVEKEDWQSYDKMNKAIIAYLDETV